jgi:hypothetical protein
VILTLIAYCSNESTDIIFFIFDYNISAVLLRGFIVHENEMEFSSVLLRGFIVHENEMEFGSRCKKIIF